MIMNILDRSPNFTLSRLALLACLLPFALGTGRDDAIAAPATQQTATNVDSTAVISHPLGTWVWNKSSWFEPADRATLFRFLKQQGISVMLLQIHTDYSGPQPALKYPEQLSAVLQQAARQGVTVHALDGDPRFIYPPWPEKLAGQIAAIGEFNAHQPPNERFVGVHYDIEPYSLPDWKKDWDSRLEVCKAYLATLDQLAPIARRRGLEFSVDIPAWFDTSENLKPFEADGYSGTLLDHVARIVDWLGIMAYRNRASGPDSILSMSQSNVAVMEKLGKKVWIGVETGPNQGGDPPKITFRNQPLADFNHALKEVDASLAPRGSYAGILIHCYERYQEYLTNAPAIKQ
jgi:hypothetical protein